MSTCVPYVDHVGQFASRLADYGRHFIAQPEVQSQIRSGAPIILEIGAEQSLPQVARGERTGNSTLEFRGLIGEKPLYIVEVPYPVRIGVSDHIEKHAFNSYAESQRMGALG